MKFKIKHFTTSTTTTVTTNTATIAASIAITVTMTPNSYFDFINHNDLLVSGYWVWVWKAIVRQGGGMTDREAC